MSRPADGRPGGQLTRGGADPGFLGLAPRSPKPRVVGLTHVIDGGTPARWLEGLLECVAEFVDVWKFGWGTSYLDPTVGVKTALLARHGVAACPGGTLLEIAWLEGKAGRFLDWAAEVGFPCVEVSNGASGMPSVEKRRLIASASSRFTVLAEVGSKDPGSRRPARAWVEEAVADLESGASWVVVEARESGTVGLYESDGRVRRELVEELLSALGPKQVVFEAPRRDQQVWFIRRLGPQANLGNVAPTDVLGLETLRRGLRADTLHLLAAEGPAQSGEGPT